MIAQPNSQLLILNSPLILVSGFEFLQESCVVFREHAQILHLVFQIGDTFDTHAESISCIDAAVYAVGFEYGRVYHAASKNFHPSGVLAEGTARSAADVATDVHFGTGFREREIRRTQTDFGVCAEHFFGEEQQYLIQVGE